MLWKLYVLFDTPGWTVFEPAAEKLEKFGMNFVVLYMMSYERAEIIRVRRNRVWIPLFLKLLVAGRS